MLRAALRSLSRQPGFVAVVVLTLAVGIGSTTTVFSVLEGVVVAPLPYDDPSRIVRLYQVEEDEPGELKYVTGAHFAGYRDSARSFAEVAAMYTYSQEGADLVVDGAAERIAVLAVGAGYFPVLGASPALGRPFTREEETGGPLVVVSHRLWEQRLGGRPDVLGEVISLSGAPHTVIGVAPAGLEDPVAGPVDAWVPLDLRPGQGRDHPQNHYLTVLARLASGTSLETARAELARLDARLVEQYPEAADARTRLVPLKADVVGGADRTLAILMAAVALVLLVACVNVANLFLIRATGRGREFAIRAALGSGRARLVRQLLLESSLLALAGGAAGVGLAIAGVDVLGAIASESVPRMDSVDVDARVLAFAVVVSLASGLLFGLLPAARFSRTRAEDVLRGVGRSSSAGRHATRVRDGLVVAQVALALMLLVGAGLLIRSFHRLSQVELGVATENVLTFRVDLPTARYDADRRAAFHDDLADRLAAEPGVVAAGSVSRLPATGTYHSWSTSPVTGPRAGESDAAVASQQRVVAGDYFDALGVRLLEGRLFSELELTERQGDGREAVLSASAAEALFPGTNALGQRVRPAGDELLVVGVVSDVALTGEGDIAAVVYHSHAQFAANRNWGLTQVVAVDTDRPASMLPTVRSVVAEIDPHLVVYEAAPLAEVVGRSRAERRFALLLLTAFSAIALGLAALGLYGVLAYSVRQRTRELAIRSALGANRRAIQRTVLGHGLAVVAIGALVGVAGSLVLGQSLSSLVFATSASDPTVLLAALATLAAAAFFAAWIPAQRATGIQPRTALEAE